MLAEFPTIQKRTKKESKFTKEYRNAKNTLARAMLAANIASGNGKCWWIYRSVMNTLTYREETT